MPSAPAQAGAEEVARQAARRRTFAIISHPDAGKTTLTEKLLLYGGAIAEAGAVHGRRGRRAATSDWMELEQRRGISVTSTVLRFEHEDVVFNLLDTPGHHDFSEDTLRVMAAADSAVMLLDAARGVQPQTLRLFEVARSRGIPLLTFINKYDRPGLEPLAMLDHIEQVLAIAPTAMTWPVGLPGDFRGVVERRTGRFHRFERSAGGSHQAGEEVVDADDAERLAPDVWPTAAEELALLDGVGHAFDGEAFGRGACTPVFFGSALSNFGVGLVLDALTSLAPAPAPRPTADGGRRSLDQPFSALVFKVQANMDPRHRDRMAFMRVCSGRFERGMRAFNSRTGRPFSMAYAADVFGQDRETLDDAFPGDVIGVVNATELLVGDTLYAEDPVTFPAIPTLAPEHFVFARNRQASRHKQFRQGIAQLAEEGVVHLLERERAADPAPILGAIGPLQFEVALERLEREFGVDAVLEPAPWKVARRTDAETAAELKRRGWAEILVRRDGSLLALFTSEFLVARAERELPEATLDRLLRS
jgi:peptide chain release factor 3